MNGVIEHIIRVKIDGKIFESVKPDEIVIDRFIAHGKRVDCQFRYAGTGRGDMAVNLKEIKTEEEQPV